MMFVLCFNCQQIMKSVELLSIIIVKVVLCQFKVVAIIVLQALGQVYLNFLLYLCV